MKYIINLLISIYVLLIFGLASCSQHPRTQRTKDLQYIQDDKKFLFTSDNLPVVTGLILLNSEPVVGKILFLGTVLVDPNSGEEIVVSLDRSSAPKFVTDVDGAFYFKNVPEGRYGLMMISGMDSFLLLYPGTQEAVLVTIEDKNIYDLGTLDYDSLPLE